MPNWTKEQLDAINKTGKNIIVSAGAGSGKTAVLSERVVTLLKKGIKINELLILTFTHAAAEEMKERIRKKICEEEEIKNNLDYLESAYITTFDSFTLSLVKKYHYLLNVSPNLKIIDDGIISIVKAETLDQIFDDLYAENNSNFNKLITDFAVKNDTNIKMALLTIIKSLELKVDLESYLNSYMTTYLSSEAIKKYIEEYTRLLNQIKDEILTNLMFIENSEYYDYYLELLKVLTPLLNAQSYDEFYHHVDITLPRRPQNSDDIKEYKDNIDLKIKSLKTYLRFSNVEEIEESFHIMKDYVEVIIEIISRYFRKIQEYKYNNDLYEFSDIAIMAIKLLKENESIRKEIKNFYKEICVDEYQDTNDIQEEFIKLIANNNVYMVGDIKQSIYGFRNANPAIFKEKYDNYSKNLAGIKIDLVKNFRSRPEVLAGINLIFSLIMDNDLGGANYKENHQMIFGNRLYEEEKAPQDYNMEILNYTLADKEYNNEEIEAFIIGKDILNKIQNEYKVVDKKTNKLRKINYDDFCIIMDRGTSFPLIKKIFEYLGIPLAIFEDKKLTTEYDMLIINNIMGFILKIKDQVIDSEFKYYFMSIARSFLFQYDDNRIFEIITNDDIPKTDIYKISWEISNKLSELNNYELLQEIIERFNLYEKLILIGNVEESIIRINNLLEMAKNLNSMGYTPYEFKEYLTKMIASKNEIKYVANSLNSNSVKIMNIHKSKGLEFPICYFCGFKKEFNLSDIKERFVYDNTYGIITPYFKEGIGTTILKDLLKNKYLINNVSERIRLLYVALTRAKEKIIIVAPLNEIKNKVHNLVDFNIRRQYNSFLSILNSISANLEAYIKNVDINELNLTKDYKLSNLKKEIQQHKSDLVIKYVDVKVPKEEIMQKHASKIINDLISENDVKTLKYGELLHKYFEQTDFLNIPDNNPYKKQIESLVRQLEITNNAKIYKEHEFIYNDDTAEYHGIIDLVVEEKNIIKIVDYKLKNITDAKYKTQLLIYYNYLKTIFKKPIKVYLYSILDDKLVEVIL